MTQQEQFDALVREKDRLTQQKQACLAEITRINGETATRTPELKYKILRRERARVVEKMTQIDHALTKLREQLRAADPERALRASRDVVVAIREIRDKYQDVAAGEHDHGPSERLLAAQFVRDLNPILRNLCHP